MILSINLTEDRGKKCAYNIEECHNDMHIKIAEISFANTIIDPWTMMIESFDTPVANITMPSPAWLYNFTMRTQRRQLKCFH